MSRSKYKGPFFKSNLIEKNNKKIKIYNKNLIILPEYVDHFIKIYNGKDFCPLVISPDMIGYKFGEFVPTRVRYEFKKKKKKK